MSKRDFDSQRRAEQEEKYRTRFLEQLSFIDGLAAAREFVTRGVPPPDSIGRIAHTNLRFFIDSLVSLQPAYPNRGTRSECAAYRSLAARLHANGQISAEMLTAVQRLTLPTM